MTARVNVWTADDSANDRKFYAAVFGAFSRYGKHADSIQRARMDANAEHFRNAKDAAEGGASSKFRADAFGGDGFFTDRELEYISARVIQTKYPVPRSFELFPRWPEAPVGAKTMTVYRVTDEGEAWIYRGGKRVPRVGVTKDEESFKFVFVVTSREMDIFERMADIFAGGRSEEYKQRAARRAIMKRVDLINWYGDKRAKIPGVLTYPYLARAEAAVTISTATTDADLIAELERLAQWPAENSEEVFSPNRCVTSKRVRNRLNRKYDDTGKTILEWFVDHDENIQAIETAPVFNDIFGMTNVDGMLFYRDDVESVALNLPLGIEELPVQYEGFSQVIYSFTMCGGAIMIDIGSALLVFWTIA